MASAHVARSASVSNASWRLESDGASTTGSRATSAKRFSARPSTYKNLWRFNQNSSDRKLKIAVDCVAKTIVNAVARIGIRLELVRHRSRFVYTEISVSV